MPNSSLDPIDRRILYELQRDGRLTNVQLAEKVNLSPSPCLRRVRQLEKSGVIQGYHASIAPNKVGLGMTIFVSIRVERHQDDTARLFETTIQTLPEVISCYLVSGESDFLLQVMVPDLQHYERFLLEKLLKIPGVWDIKSNFAIRRVKETQEIPLDL